MIKRTVQLRSLSISQNHRMMVAELGSGYSARSRLAGPARNQIHGNKEPNDNDNNGTDETNDWELIGNAETNWLRVTRATIVLKRLKGFWHELGNYLKEVKHRGLQDGRAAGRGPTTADRRTGGADSAASSSATTTARGATGDDGQHARHGGRDQTTRRHH